MVVTSHLVIADYVHQYIVEETGLELDLKHFRYGNIKPDIKKGYYGVGHYYGESIEVVEQIQQLILDNKMDLKTLSVELGCICHFITDYFCHYHANDHMVKGPIAKHLLYEIHLHKHIKEAITQKSNISFDVYGDNLRDKLLFIQNHYASRSASKKRDALYALSSTTILLKGLVDAFISKYNLTSVPSVNQGITGQAA